MDSGGQVVGPQDQREESLDGGSDATHLCAQPSRDGGRFGDGPRLGPTRFDCFPRELNRGGPENRACSWGHGAIGRGRWSGRLEGTMSALACWVVRLGFVSAA